MLTLAPCPHCASRVPDDGAYCDTCGRSLAACASCGELVRPGEKCLTHGVAAVLRSPAKQNGVTAPAAPVTHPTVAPPPRRGARPGAPGGTVVSPASASTAVTAQPSLGGGQMPGELAATPVVHAPGGAPFPAAAAAVAAPTHAAQGTTVQLLARKLRLVVTGGVALPPLEVEAETIVGRGEGPFAMLLDPFHDKGLSRRHCQFRRGATGTWSIVDLAGRGSTFVSADGTWTGPPVAPNASHLVEPGRDQIRLGLLTFKVEAIT